MTASNDTITPKNIQIAVYSLTAALVEAAPKVQLFYEGLGRVMCHWAKAMRPFVEEAKRHEQYGEDRVLEFIFDGMQREIARKIAPDLDVDTIAPGVLRKKIADIRWQRKPM